MERGGMVTTLWEKVAKHDHVPHASPCPKSGHEKTPAFRKLADFFLRQHVSVFHSTPTALLWHSSCPSSYALAIAFFK